MLSNAKLTRALNRVASLLCAVTFGAALPAAGVGVALTPQPVMAQEAADDVIVFKSGQQVQGTIIEETPTSVRMKVVIAGIAAETTYSQADILTIKRGAAKSAPAAAPASSSATAPAPAAASVSPAPAEAGAPKVYVIELTGWFGEDISQTPMRQAVKDAKANDVDYLIVVMDNDWSLRRRGSMEDLKDDDGMFDQFWRAEDMDVVFTEEIQRQWTKQPKVIFWVKKAMGGAAFLPFNCPNIYFHSDGKMGGIGHLENTVKSGDQVVKEKLFGARMGHVEGMAVRGGYDPRIIRAMARDDYVLSYKMVGGKPVFLEREPAAPDEFALTNDATKEENKDSEIDLARGQGKNVLTLNADLAYKLGVSKGTVDSLDDLFHQIGLRSHSLVKGQSASIMKNWRDGLDKAKRDLPKLWDKYQEVQVGGNYSERTRARGQQINLINQMQAIEKRYEEALNPRSVGVLGWNDLETLKQQIKLQQSADKDERR